LRFHRQRRCGAGTRPRVTLARRLLASLTSRPKS